MARLSRKFALDQETAILGDAVLHARDFRRSARVGLLVDSLKGTQAFDLNLEVPDSRCAHVLRLAQADLRLNPTLNAYIRSEVTPSPNADDPPVLGKPRAEATSG